MKSSSPTSLRHKVTKQELHECSITCMLALQNMAKFTYPETLAIMYLHVYLPLKPNSWAQVFFEQRIVIQLIKVPCYGGPPISSQQYGVKSKTVKLFITFLRHLILLGQFPFRSQPP